MRVYYFFLSFQVVVPKSYQLSMQITYRKALLSQRLART